MNKELYEIFDEIKDRNKEGSERQIILPNLIEEGFSAGIDYFSEFCKKINRKEEIVKKFLKNKTGISIISDSRKLLFKGKITKATLKKVIISYLDHFVYCQKCKKPDTIENPREVICTACSFIKNK